MKNHQGSQVVGKARLILSLLTLSLILFTNVSVSQAATPPVDDDPHSGRNPKLDSYLANLAAAAESSPDEALALAESGSLRLSGDRVHVQIVTHAPGLDGATQAVTAR
jgi:hypothetical protein